MKFNDLYNEVQTAIVEQFIKGMNNINPIMGGFIKNQTTGMFNSNCPF